MVLAPVIGATEYCTPCALSALTGAPADSWPDEAMTWTDVQRHLAARCAVDPLPAQSWVIGRRLLAFCALGLVDAELPAADPVGRWLLLIDKAGDDDAAHIVAVAVAPCGIGGWRRTLADNRHRTPTGLAAVARSRPYSSAVVVGGVRILERTRHGAEAVTPAAVQLDLFDPTAPLGGPDAAPAAPAAPPRMPKPGESGATAPGSPRESTLRRPLTRPREQSGTQKVPPAPATAASGAGAHESGAIPARCPVTNRPGWCVRADCRHWADGCAHPEATRPRRRRR